MIAFVAAFVAATAATAAVFAFGTESGPQLDGEAKLTDPGEFVQPEASVPVTGDVKAAAEAEAKRLEGMYPRDLLGRLAFAGGFEADMVDNDISRSELAALEELDEDE